MHTNCFSFDTGGTHANHACAGAFSVGGVSARTMAGWMLTNGGIAAAVALPRAYLATRLPFSTARALSRDHATTDGSSSAVSNTQQSLKFKALLVDAGGTLLQPLVPVEETYAAFGVKHGLNVSTKDIKKGFKKAFAEPWPERLRYEGDGRTFWRFAVAQATGCEDEIFFEELYCHYSKAAAWILPDDAISSLRFLKDSGVKLGVISNFDTRLRPLLDELNVANLFHSIIVSCEVGYEKPAPQIFEAALRTLGVQPQETVLVGDDPIADKKGAEAVGISAWLWKKDVHSFKEVAERFLQC